MHIAASASEKRTIEVAHKDLEEIFEFKTRTEFWGAKRDHSGGWLADYNRERNLGGFEAYKPEEFTIKDIQIPEPIAYCLNTAKKYIFNICTKLDCFDYEVFVGKGETFRERIILPEGRRYKQNRDNLTKSVHVEAVKQYLIDHHDAQVIEDIEVDDHLAMIGYANYKRVLAGNIKEEDMDIVVARDKDAMACEGWLFNPDKMKKPYYIQGLGKLWRDPQGKIRGAGRKFKYFQLLFGDTVDHYNPRVILGNTFRYGEKSIYKDLAHLETDKECLELVVKKYRQFMPEPIIYKAWDGSTETDDWLSWLQKHLELQHMLRFEGDNVQIVDILNKLGVDYE